ncbi:hypothetical protein V8C34DRAFT_269181 [Trichoderma compactum]
MHFVAIPFEYLELLLSWISLASLFLSLSLQHLGIRIARQSVSAHTPYPLHVGTNSHPLPPRKPVLVLEEPNLAAQKASNAARQHLQYLPQRCRLLTLHSSAALSGHVRHPSLRLVPGGGSARVTTR